jgi:hypothetical protein
MLAHLLRLVGFVEAGVAAALILFVVGHGVFAAEVVRASERRLARVRAALESWRLEGDLAGTRWYRWRPWRSEVEVLRLTAALSGQAASGLWAGISDHLGDRASRWCRSRRWWLRLRGARLLALIGAPSTVIRSLLEDPHPMVRAAATASVDRQSDPATVATVLRLLDDPDRRCRLAAHDTLVRVGQPAVPALLGYLTRSPAAGRPLALQVARGLPDPRFLGPALAAGRDDEPSVREAGATLLAAVSGGEAERALVGLIDDPVEEVRVAAVRGLSSIGSWAEAPALARRLRDSAFEVRRAAGLGLRRLGPAGRLYLRRSLSDSDPYAADMARQVLGLPDSAADW